MRNIALIPARSGSKRLPKKNIMRLNGHPLIAYTIASAIESQMFESVFVSTDSPEYAKIATYYGASVEFMRPKEFATDLSPDFEWVDFTLGELLIRGREYDRFAILRPTSPFRSSATIKRAFKEFSQSGDADSIRAVEICKQHPAKMWTIEAGILVPVMPGANTGVDWFSSPTQSLPEIWAQNASLEIAKVECVTRMKSITGKIIIPFKTQFPEGLDVNTPEDFKLAELLLTENSASLPKIALPSFEN